MRRTLWDRLANEWRPPHLDAIISKEVSLENLGGAFDVLMKGDSLGRTVVNLA
jgi:hypothetical protein